MKITRLEVDQYMGTRHIVIEPGNRHALLIGGMNEEGKSSLIGAIGACLSGRESADEPIRHGKKRATIVMDTEDPEWTIERKFTKKGTTLVIKNADGVVQKKPQQLLNEIIGTRCLDPLAFMKLKAREQRDTLVDLVDLGIDLFAHDCERKKVYDLRAAHNVEIKRLRFAIEEKEDTTPVPDEIDVSVVIDELRKLREVRETQDSDLRTHEAVVGRIASKRSDIEESKQRIADLQTLVADAESEVVTLETRLHAAELDLGTHISDVDLARKVADAEDAISGAAKSNADREAIITAREAHASLSGELKREEVGARKCKRDIDRLDDKKADALAAAKMPVDGLGFDEDGVLWKGLPLSQASGARRVRISLALAAALRPGLRDIWTTEAEKLDERSLEVVKAFAAAHDPPLRIWLERVGEGDEGAIIIRDGEVVSDEQEAA